MQSCRAVTVPRQSARTRGTRFRGTQTHARAFGRTLWWSCNLCNFQVFKHETLKGHCGRRKRHLNQVHKIPLQDIPALPRTQSSRPPINGKAVLYKLRWKILWKLYQQERWPASHDIPEKPSACSKPGNPFHKRKKCHKVIRRNEVLFTTCSSAPSVTKAPGLPARKKQWAAWRKQANKNAMSNAKIWPEPAVTRLLPRQKWRQARSRRRTPLRCLQRGLS